MSDNREWDSFEGDDVDEPRFRQFPDHQKHTPAGDKGLWSILDSVARQPSRPEQSPRVESAPTEPVADPVPPPATYLPPSPPPAASSAFLQSDNPGSTKEFGHLFRRQREEPPAASAKTTSLKSLFKRISR